MKKLSPTDKEFIIESMNNYRMKLKSNLSYNYKRLAIIYKKEAEIDKKCDNIITKVLNL